MRNEVSVEERPRLFKNEMGMYLLKGLFFEFAEATDKKYVMYTLKQREHNGLPSLHQLYVEMNDPTEYEFATKYFDGWTHWKRIKECNWFKPYYDEMREELEVKIRAKALKDLRAAAKDTKNTVQVNKYLMEKGWLDKDDKRGRPSKEAIKKEADKVLKEADLISEDYGRIVALNAN